MIWHKAIRRAKGVNIPYSVFGYTKIIPVYAALRAVHIAPCSAIAIVQQLCGKAGQNRTLCGLKEEGRNSCGILAKVNNKGLARLNGNLCARSIFPDRVPFLR